MKTIISSATKTRDNSIDILRSFALIAIILIHCHPDSNFVCQLTEFNVPMMVFLSNFCIVSLDFHIYLEHVIQEGILLKV